MRSRMRMVGFFSLLLSFQLFFLCAVATECSDPSRCETDSSSESGIYKATTNDGHEKGTLHRPSCSASGKQPMRRVVGYYEGRASSRNCNLFKPWLIPDGVYTHVNFAFAKINPETFEIAPAVQDDFELYEQLAEKKQIDPNLKVFIAIGGSAFSDSDTTGAIFSDIVRSSTKQKAFIASIITFVYKYDFDGVDISWAYPAAPDRHGRREDFDNLPKFLANLKAAMRQSGSRNGLSIALPASNWYLRYFDIKRIAKHVDFFNLMSYDLHGSLNMPQPLIDDQMKTHTNLTEIKDSLDLLWLNGIDPDQVNMGLAFHARTFEPSDRGCLSPGCLFDAGGDPGFCSETVGYLANSEFHYRLRSRKKAGVGLDEKAAVKIMSSGMPWLSYDDGDTWKLKLDFARSQCLGGAMVWAINQDTRKGDYSKQLQSATGYQSSQITPAEDYVDDFTGWTSEDKFEASANVIQEQCRWTNCGGSCPSYWQAVIRQDDGRQSLREKMLDSTGCGGRGARTFCCPPGEQPRCGWQHFKRGQCSPGCDAEDEHEVASTGIGCNNGKTQSACCSGNTPSIDVYRRSSPKPFEHEDQDMNVEDEGPAANEPLWANCGWYTKSFSSLPLSKATQCDASCPGGMTKLALKGDGCESGQQAFCCSANVTRPGENPFTDFEDALAAWVKAPTCPIPNRPNPSGFSAPRMVVIPGLVEILSESPNSQHTKRLREIWDALVLPRWGNLNAKRLASMFR